MAQIRIYSIGASGKKPDVLLPCTGGAPIDPTVFGYIRVSQAEGESGLATQRRIFTDVASGKNMHRPSWKDLRGCSNQGTRWWSRGLTAWRGTSLKDSRPSRSFTARASTSAPWRRDWTPATTAPPRASCSTCCSPWRVGEGHHPGPDQGRRRPRRGRGQDQGQASGAVVREGGGRQGFLGERRVGQRCCQNFWCQPAHRARRQGRDGRGPRCHCSTITSA